MRCEKTGEEEEEEEEEERERSWEKITPLPPELWMDG